MMSRSPSPDPRSPAMSIEEKLLTYIQMCYPDCPRVKFASSRHILLDQYHHLLKVCRGSLLGGTGLPMDEVVCGVILCRLYKCRNALPSYEGDGYDVYGPQQEGFLHDASKLVFEFAETMPSSGIPSSGPNAVEAERRRIQELIYSHTKTLWRVASRRFEAGLKRCREERIKISQQELLLKTLLSYGQQWAGVAELAHHHQHGCCSRPEEFANYCTHPRNLPSWRRVE